MFHCSKNHIIFLVITYIITIDANIPNIVIIGVNISCVINLSKIVAFITFFTPYFFGNAVGKFVMFAM